MKINNILDHVVNKLEIVNFLPIYESLGIDARQSINQKTGELMVSDDIEAVAVAKIIIQKIELTGFKVGKKEDSIYFFEGSKWINISTTFWYEFLKNCAIKLKSNFAKYLTAKFQILLRQTILVILPNLSFDKSNSNAIKINFVNGTLQIANNQAKLLAHCHDDYFTYCLPYEYLPNDGNAPQFFNYLSRVLPELQSRELLQELLGSVLVKDLNLEFLAIFLGNGANGKSVLHQIVLALFGIDNVSTLSWSQLFEPTELIAFEGKLLNYGSEISLSKNTNLDLIKKLCSREHVTIRKRYQQSSHTTNYGRMFFNANKLPDISDSFFSFMRRLQLVIFDETIDPHERNINLASNIIKTELTAIINWVIEGAVRISTNMKFTESTKSKRVLENYSVEQCTVSIFINEYVLVPTKTHKILLNEVFNLYIGFCSERKYRCVHYSEFSARLRQNGFEIRKANQNKTFMFAEGFPN